MNANNGNAPCEIRPATASDLALILSFIRELAEYEKLEHEAVTNEELLNAALFSPNPAAEVILAFSGEAPAGFALFFQSFSTFLGRPGIYLEDLFVRLPYRRRGIGTELFRRIARIAIERGCGRLEWSVLNWNRSSIEFYQRLDASPMSDWTTYRLTGVALDRLSK